MGHSAQSKTVAESTDQQAADSGPEERAGNRSLDRSPGSKIFLALLGVVSLLYAAVLIYHVSVPPGEATDHAFLEQCRQICLKYGLVSTGNVRHDARAYLTAVDAKPLSEELSSILEDPAFVPASTQSHDLLGKPAPDFRLLNHERNPRQLSALLQEGPIVLVFYYGYSCSHCVAQLYSLNDDLHYFSELGAKIVAVSGDAPEKTAMSFAEYGRFDFTVLSDPENAIAGQFGCYEPPSSDSQGMQQHGTFLLDRDGTVVWAYRGVTPFIDNKSLLVRLSKLTGDKEEAGLALFHQSPGLR